MAKRFLNCKNDLMREIVDLLTKGFPSFGIRCVTVTQSWDNDKEGNCIMNTNFPYNSSIEITWKDEFKAEDYLETIIHELTHAYSNALGFVRNSISEDKKMAVDECYSSLTGAISRNVYENYPAIKKLLDQFIKTPKED